MNTTLSIIIPCYNEENLIASKIENLLKNTSEKSTEIIVVDSPKSSDKTEAILKQYTTVSYYKCDKPGRAFQMNYGAKMAKNSAYIFVHADVTLPNNYYELIDKSLKNNACGFFNYEFDKVGFWMRFNASFVKKKGGMFTGGGDQCHFFKKATFEELNGYNEAYCIMEDFELIDRVRNGKIPYEIIETPVIVSARKYEENSWLKISLVNGYVFFSYKMGVSPEKLKKRYKSLTRK